METLKFASKIYWPLVFIFLSISNFDIFHTFLNLDDFQYLAHQIQQPIPNSENSDFLPKSFTSFVWIFVNLFFIRNNLICLKNRDNYSYIEPIVSCLGKVV